jgi:SynChlorMet cassette radical SAM/SPASM protein ScmE
MAELTKQAPAKMKVMSTPRSVDIAITGRCNLNCAYCFYADEMVARDDLPTERWLAFFDELGRLGVRDVTLTGGEVFTRRDFFTLVDGVIANRMRYSLLSNGTLITEKMLEQFEIGKRRTRLDSIQISIDGSTADIHDQSRPKSFERAVRGLRLLKKAGYPVTVRVTINRYNVDDLETITRLLLDDVGLSGFSTNEAYPCGATNRYERGIRLSIEQRAQVMRVLTDLNKRYNGRISAQAGPLVLAHEFERIDAALAAGQTCFPGRGMLAACGGVFSKIAVMHDGTIVPCHTVHPLRMGNIQTDSLAQVWRDHETMNVMRLRRQIPLGELETCKDCKYQGFCTGSCPGGAILLGDGLEVRNPYDCYRVLRGEDPYFSLDEATSAGTERA